MSRNEHDAFRALSETAKMRKLDADAIHDRHPSLSETAKMRVLDVAHGEIRRERRKNPRGSDAVVLTPGERNELNDLQATLADDYYKDMP